MKQEEIKKELAITYEQIKITPLELLHLEEFELKQKENEHTILHITGTVKEEEAERLLLYVAAGSKIEVFYQTETEESRCLFRGVMTEAAVTQYKELKRLSVEAMSHTYWLDQGRISRSFQNTGATYAAIMEQVIGEIQGAKITWLSSAANPTNEVILQYQETNWEFLKRMASRMYTGLIPISNSKTPSVYFGTTEQKQAQELPVLRYSMKKDIRSYQIESSYIPGMKENDYLTYEVISYAIRQAGEAVSFHNVVFYIKEASFQIQNGLLVATYQLGTRNSLKQQKIYREQIAGISLNGTIQGVQRDRVRVRLQIDGPKGQASYYFPYSTIAASPDGSGWYCMPEPGDEVRVYFPDREEKNCYAISSVSGYQPAPGDTTDRMSDPNVKYLRTASGQSILLNNNNIEINSSDGKALIRLDEEGVIHVYGEKSVNIEATEGIYLTATQDIVISAKDSLVLQAMGGKLEMTKDNLIRLQGIYIMEN